MAKVAPLLDIELIELDRAACCGAGVIAEHNQELADTLNARTFALAQQTDGELMMNICSTCQGAQSECQERLDANTEYREHINANLSDEGLSYKSGLTNKNFLWLLVEEIGLDALKAKVKRPLTDLKVGPFYGCYIVRPVHRLGVDEEHPRDRYMHMVIEALGGTVIDYAGVYKCCGFPIITMNKEASLKMAGRHLGDAIDAEADCLVVPCPSATSTSTSSSRGREGGRARARPAGAASPPAGRAGPRARSQGARDGQARGQADLGDRLVELGRRRRVAGASLSLLGGCGSAQGAGAPGQARPARHSRAAWPTGAAGPHVRLSEAARLRGSASRFILLARPLWHLRRQPPPSVPGSSLRSNAPRMRPAFRPLRWGKLG